MNIAEIKKVIVKFDSYLAQEGLSFEAIIIGGAALNIMDVISRLTRDVDFLDPEIPIPIKLASETFARKFPELGIDPKTWINNGPESLLRDLPPNWRDQTVKIYRGNALTLWTLGRMDLLRSKLFACADRDIDFNDCIALKPSLNELELCLP